MSGMATWRVHEKWMQPVSYIENAIQVAGLFSQPSIMPVWSAP